MVDVGQVPSKRKFNEQHIKAFVVGEQNFRSGQRSVACGDVTAVKFVNDRFEGFVHAEKTGNQNYQVTATFTPDGSIGEVSCCCVPRVHRHHRCKHTSAMLHALLALRSYAPPCRKPIWSHRPSVARFAAGMHAQFRAAVRADLTWLDVLARLIAPTPRHLGSYAPRKRTLAHVAAHKEAKKATSTTSKRLFPNSLPTAFLLCSNHSRGSRRRTYSCTNGSRAPMIRSRRNATVDATVPLIMPVRASVSPLANMFRNVSKIFQSATPTRSGPRIRTTSREHANQPIASTNAPASLAQEANQRRIRLRHRFLFFAFQRQRAPR